MSPAARYIAQIVMLVFTSCAGTPPKPESEKTPKEEILKVAKVKVSDKCQQAVDRQVDNSGFALVISASDVLTPEHNSEVDRLYRRIHGIPGVESVRSIADEQVVEASELEVAVEPFLSDAVMQDRTRRVERYQQYHHVIDPVLLSRDQGTTVLIVSLLPTTKTKTRADVREKILSLLKSSKTKMRMNLLEYPVAARESLHWPTRSSLEALDTLNRDLAGGGVLEVSVSCPKSDCLTDPAHLSAMEQFIGIVETMPRVRSTRSVITIIRAVHKARSGQDSLPATADEVLGLLALVDRNAGVPLLISERNSLGRIRVYFETGSAQDYCKLGQALKKATKESSSETLRFKVRKPDRRSL